MEQATADTVAQATYPLPQPLVERLQAGLSATNTSATVDSPSQGLEHLVSNAIQALDSLYFGTAARIRKHPAFAHRLCLRVATNPAKQQLSITDLGVGMTRTDLINTLGVGKAGLTNPRQAPSRQSSSAGTESTDYDDEDDDDDDDDDIDTCDNGEEDDDDDDLEDGDDDDDEQSNPQGDNGNHMEEDDLVEDNETMQVEPSAATNARLPLLDCTSTSLGGFYAALCALGKGVRVGTKAKFDDYYEFQIAMNDNESNTPDVQNFGLVRPMEEGATLTVENGFDKFHHVRGDCGTCVTFQLNDQSIQQGYLDEENLKPTLLKIVETTQYSVAFSSDPGASEIIQASAKEAAEVAVLLQQQQEDDRDDDVQVESLNVGAEQLETANNHKRSVSGSHNSVMERSKYIPLRLSLGERKMLRLVEATMNCCDYTTEVDRTFSSASRRAHSQLKGATSVFRGLVTSCDYEAGQKLLQDDNYTEYETYFRQIFEIARRHKIMNPEKMRTEYGKLIYLLQDSVSPTVQPHLAVSVKGPIESVYKFLDERGGTALLSDNLIETATAEILALGRPRQVIDQEIRQKERAVQIIKRKYETNLLTPDDIHLCLYSICDNNSFLNSNRVPIDKIIDYLKTHFSPHQAQPGYSLAIVKGEDGSRLSHSHERQYYYALQSLTLWRDIIDDMFRLWAMAEEDLLSETVSYRLQDTGQGMQRVQPSPRAYKAMQQVLSRVQNSVGHWVGSSVIHMGDHNVPNALSFIDKYTQVPRILGPIVSCIESLERIYEEDEGIQAMIDDEDGFGGLDKVKSDILYDFFRSAFDGSGSDLWYDAGSCVDGRLTSAWNWCSQLPTKPYYSIFKLTGFVGFDGEFK